MSEMAAARFNVFWFLSFLAPAAIMLLAASLKEKRIFVAGAVVSLVATYTLCNLAVQEKWQTRVEIAKTENQLEAATADGANTVFTAYLFAPLEAVLYTWFWGYIGRKAWPVLKKRRIET
jgi:uncharacterized membrane protein